MSGIRWGRSIVVRVTAVVALTAGIPVMRADDAEASGTVLGVDGSRFTINGQPRFLLGFSYYGALGAPRGFVLRDLDDMRRQGFNWLRVWATWGGFDHVVSAVDAEGNPRQRFMDHLAWLVGECDARGMVVDVTLARHESDDPDGARGLMPNSESHRRAVESIVERLRAHRNWYLDLANERDVGDARFVGPDELRRLRERVRDLNPSLLVTASFGGHDLGRDDIENAVNAIGVDFLAPHRPRHPGSPGETQRRTEEVLTMLREVGRVVPIHHQEPFRRGYTGGWEPTAEEFLRDLRGAVAGGAAGWCFHNGAQRGVPDEQPRRSFDLRERRLLDQLDPEELGLVRGAARVVASAVPGG